MAFVTSTTQAAAPLPAAETPESSFTGGDAALLLMGAMAGATMTKAAKKQYAAMPRNMARQQLGMQFKGLFSKKYRKDSVMGLSPLVFWLLVAAVGLLGILVFGLWGFLVIAALGLILYLLIKKS